ncbi:hypothetical protein Hs30E_20160 [Lactococcus hodotermopsidis]|uniref:Type VII secretion protein EssB n=1 Tax=Pseudolactococcus hodotermopsidis TaxID=2709157 RepID=A0A6A0BFI0_9LACT|nr:type VII secretion protein EssB [Lactococcus hodotermopsidis]GFH43465.1 hypothetical protein Hs30E_20160 [Lactococcus hodotermopsidis]
MQLFNGKEKIELINENNKVQVWLEKTQYDNDSLSVIQKYVQAEEVDEKLLITYDLPKTAIPFGLHVADSQTKLDKLLLADKVSQLVDLTGKYAIPFIHPNTVYLDGERLFVVYSGLEDMLAPAVESSDLFLKNVKALILSIFNQKLSYEKLLEGSSALNDKFLRTLVKATTTEEVFELVRKELAATQEKISHTKQLVSRRGFQTYRFVGTFAIIVALVLSGFLYHFLQVNQKQTAIIKAQTSFMTNNYAQTQTDLEKYKPKDLTKSAKYVLAISSINLTDLTAAQKQAILNNISIKSDNNTLDYWVYVGRGKFEAALNLAQNLGDDQLTLLAYTDLYQATKLNNKMDGAKKQKLLDDYSKQIDELTEKLGK